MTAILEGRTAQDNDTPATPVFAAPIRHRSAWTVADFRSPADYAVDLSAAQLRDIAAAMRRIKAAGIGLDGLQREHFEVPSLRPVVEEIRRQVEDGRGFVLLRRLPIEDYSKDDLGARFGRYPRRPRAWCLLQRHPCRSRGRVGGRFYRDARSKSCGPLNGAGFGRTDFAETVKQGKRQR